MFGSKKKVMCTVCGTELTPRREKTIRTNGGVTGMLSAPVCFDVMDCPECGCQITLKAREVVEYIKAARNNALEDDAEPQEDGE